MLFQIFIVDMQPNKILKEMLLGAACIAKKLS